MAKGKKEVVQHVCVVATAQRHTAIKIGETDKHVVMIPMDSSGLQVKHVGHGEFNAEWAEIQYPPREAAKKYLASEVSKLDNTTAEARNYLSDIASGKLTTANKEIQMATATATKKTAAKATPKAAPPAPGKKTAGAKAAPAKAAAKPAGKAPAAKPAPKAKAKAPAKAGGRASVVNEANADKVKKLLGAKGGTSVEAVMEAVGVCKKSAVKLLKAAGAKAGEERGAYTN